jgi:hypothetical protein
MKRFGAICGILCGLFIALPGGVEAFTGETSATSFVLGLSPALAPPLLVALHLRQAGRAGRLGGLGYAVNLVGLGLFGGAAFTLNLAFFYLDEEPHGLTRVALLGSALVFVVGTVLFGISMLRAKVLPTVPALGYTIGLPLFALLAPLPDSVLTSVLHVLVGIVLIWLGRALLVTRAAVPAYS